MTLSLRPTVREVEEEWVEYLASLGWADDLEIHLLRPRHEFSDYFWEKVRWFGEFSDSELVLSLFNVVELCHLSSGNIIITINPNLVGCYAVSSKPHTILP